MTLSLHLEKSRSRQRPCHCFPETPSYPVPILGLGFPIAKAGHSFKVSYYLSALLRF